MTLTQPLWAVVTSTTGYCKEIYRYGLFSRSLPTVVAGPCPE